MSSQIQEHYATKLWGGRFTGGPTEEVLKFSSSIGVDQRLWLADLLASQVHAKMLGRQGIVSAEESQLLVAGLDKVRDKTQTELNEGRNPFAATLEDVHSLIEIELKNAIGVVAGKLHTARSRNDQVVTAFRLYLLNEVEVLKTELKELQQTLLTHAEAHIESPLPGLTHFQHGQPVTLAHHLLAYFWMFNRDNSRLTDWDQRTRELPLGSAALAGTSFNLDRHWVAEQLGFLRPTANSLDAVSDRDFAFELLSALSLVGLHMSRLCEEFVVWASPEFQFIRLSDTVTTGSSIMPQKKNPDVAELIRGRAGHALGSLVQLATTIKGLPLSYNRDLQEDKEPVFRALDSSRACVRMLNLMLKECRFNTEKMLSAIKGDTSNATDLADYLAKKGLPFREAHHLVGVMVNQALEIKKPLEDWSLSEFKTFSPLFEADVISVIQPLNVVEARNSYGGTAPKQVRNQIAIAKAQLDATVKS